MPTHEMRPERRLIADSVGLLKQTFEKVPILLIEVYLWNGISISCSVFARIERGQGADLGKGHFCARPIILRALLRVILHFEGTMGK